MRITKATAIKSLQPAAEFVITGDVLTWISTNIPQPTDAEIDAELDRLIAAEPARIAEQNRKAAYIAESDPLFFKAQRGEATIEEWQTKIVEIKTRYPKDQ